MSRTEVLFNAVPVTLESNGKKIDTWALLDKCSDSTLIDNTLAKQLNLQGPHEITIFNTVYGSGETVDCKRVDFRLLSRTGSVNVHVTGARVIPKLEVVNRCSVTREQLRGWPHLHGISLPTRPDRIPLIVGRDVDVHDVLEVRKPETEGPSAERTVFGWSLVGKVPTQFNSRAAAAVYFACTRNRNTDLHDLVYRFQTTESFGVRVAEPRRPAEEVRTEAIFNATTKLLENGHYEFGLFWKTDNVRLPNNYSAALRALIRNESRYLQDPLFAEKVKIEMDSLVASGFARKLEPHEEAGPEGRTWYLPYHAVRHPARPDKIRMVFDASASHDGTSLNKNFLKGTELITNLNGNILRFRRDRVPVSADIAKMFLQVFVRKQKTKALYATSGGHLDPRSRPLFIRCSYTFSVPFAHL